jgi:purine-nucleoside phosphorylase
MHHYEGYSFVEVSYAVRVIRLLGPTPRRNQRRRGVNLDFKAAT